MVMSVSAKYVGGPFFNPETMQTATFYIISPDKKSPSHIRCVHTQIPTIPSFIPTFSSFIPCSMYYYNDTYNIFTRESMYDTRTTSKCVIVIYGLFSPRWVRSKLSRS